LLTDIHHISEEARILYCTILKVASKNVWLLYDHDMRSQGKLEKIWDPCYTATTLATSPATALMIGCVMYVLPPLSFNPQLEKENWELVHWQRLLFQVCHIQLVSVLAMSRLVSQ
jgi:hypothetical protein